MNLFFNLPEELQREIYTYDCTYRDQMKYCFEEIKNREKKKKYIREIELIEAYMEVECEIYTIDWTFKDYFLNSNRQPEDWIDLLPI